MARKSKGRKRKGGPVDKLIQFLFMPKSLAILTALAIIIGLVILTKNYLYNSPTFVIKESEMKGDGVEDSYLFRKLSNIGIGENIFSIELGAISNSLKKEHFEIKDLHIEKVFPNKLVFYVTKRKAIAQINSKNYYRVDEEGVILKDTSRTVLEGLPVIGGIYVTDKDIGKKFNYVGLDRALSLIKELSKSNVLESHNVSDIDASDSENISFSIDDGLEVKMGGEDFSRKLELLKKTLRNPDINAQGILYIDLRFKEVVVKPR
ncbi:MAG: hypothetical protein COS99_04625 [Candidatus Omnitrophica bacterium CG07_land_8_20_14_0_80_42_15]|uniref:Cell division protein FtsQ/DivIB C-terminal domain-containing protein n=1 Tax=Candidatus Aquitaenariimonas noxiae TaxID=1974741 RepID=A0A2J0KSW0_9BACT|nr:MAG: hypothetical protein COS99_04625 [Candidatus Omnitrophica bacterium CG07_land_8_20_14_0_80_42_15]